ncbi:MAG: alpha-E domain-containing protein [Sphingobacteriales bacterium]|nr:MAG: alpha-E domain-containing protein [Sphingobacteriales bacterium]
MLSRIADSLFWMNRYMERAEGMLRILKINYATSLDSNADEVYDWYPVLNIFSMLEEEQMNAIRYQTQDVLQYVIADKNNQNSIRTIITKARENARGLQDQITKELWESINEYYLKFSSNKIDNLLATNRQSYAISSLIDQSLFYYGVAEVTMPRGEGWNFMGIGKNIERAMQTADIVDMSFHDINYDLNNPMDISYWKNLSMSLSGYEFYLKTYPTGLQTQNVIDLILMNTNFPRSIFYSVKKISYIMEKLAQQNVKEEKALLHKIGRLKSHIEYTDLNSIQRIGLNNFLEEIRGEIYEFNYNFSKYYFAYR